MRHKILDRTILDDGQVILTNSSLFKSLFIDSKFRKNCIAEDSIEVQEYNKFANMFDMQKISTTTIKIDHEKNKEQWLMPTKYVDLDIKKYLLDLCQTEIQIQRVNDELFEYENRGLLNLLRYLKYFVDIVKENNLFLGIGRGSSVSSYCLYLIGLHKIDSITYELDYKQFLK